MPDPIVGRDVPGPPESEARFTAPTELCPHPERWSSTDGDSTEMEVSVLAGALVRALQPDLCVETGTGFGQTALSITRALTMNGRGVLVSFENDPERVAYVRARARFWYPLNLVDGDPLDYDVSAFSPHPIGFAWLDTFYERRVAEFLHLRPAMRPGTIVCFHDTAPGHGAHRIASGRDLRSEVEAELAGLVRLVHLPTPRGLTICEVLGP